MGERLVYFIEFSKRKFGYLIEKSFVPSEPTDYGTVPYFTVNFKYACPLTRKVFSPKK